MPRKLFHRQIKSGLAKHLIAAWHRRTPWIKIPVYLALVAAIICSAGYGIAEWYIQKHNDEPLILGTTFISDYAKSYGLDPHQTYIDIITGLGVKQIRLVSYWEDIETSPGHYDFSELDWEMSTAQQYGVKISLSVGLRQPRWPECHAPSWVNPPDEATWYPQLKTFMGAVVNRYKNNPALDNYQLENEYFLAVFGECRTYTATRERLIDEYNYIKSLDSQHPIVLSLANNYAGTAIGQPVPDYYGISVYKRVFDTTITHRYFEYPYPPWYYAARSGILELLHGKSSVIHELQAEPWGNKPILDMTLQEQDITMNADILQKRIKYAEDTGMRSINLWGAEWWLWRKDKMNDPSLWNVAKQAIAEANAGDH